MNLTITKEQILAGLQAVQNVVSTRTTLPILSNVLLRAEKDRVEFTATDLDVTVACSVEAQVKKAGATTVPVKKLFGIVRELNGNEIELETDEKNITSIRSGSSFYKIHGLGADEFPPLPKFKDDKKSRASAGKRPRDAQENFICRLHRRIALRPQRHFHQSQGRQDDARGHRRTPSRARGRRSGHLRKKQR